MSEQSFFGGGWCSKERCTCTIVSLGGVLSYEQWAMSGEQWAVICEQWGRWNIW